MKCTVIAKVNYIKQLYAVFKEDKNKAEICTGLDPLKAVKVSIDVS